MTKFRAWDIETKEMCEVDLINWNMNTAMLKRDGVDAYGVEIKDIILMQYTGLKDEKGKEIYEGDKIAFNVNKQFGTNKRYEGKVYFCKTRLSYCVDSSSAWDMPISRNLRDIEIIGNIHQNPKLTETK